MISPSPIEHHLEIERAIGSRTRRLDSTPGGGLMQRLRRRHDVALDGLDATITIRIAAAQDAAAITRLSELDGHRLPAGKRLVAVACGRIVAAADVTTGTTIADPFEPTAGVAQLVALRARQLRPRAA